MTVCACILPCGGPREVLRRARGSGGVLGGGGSQGGSGALGNDEVVLSEVNLSIVQ